MTQRRGNKPVRPSRPFKPIPVLTGKYQPKIPAKQKKPSLVQRIKELGNRIRGWFRRRNKRSQRTTIKSKWQTEDRPQWVIDRARRKANLKTRNRRNRKQTRALHQLEWRRA